MFTVTNAIENYISEGKYYNQENILVISGAVAGSNSVHWKVFWEMDSLVRSATAKEKEREREGVMVLVVQEKWIKSKLIYYLLNNRLMPQKTMHLSLTIPEKSDMIVLWKC